MSATLRLLEAINRGDSDLPDHDGTLKFLKVLLKPIYNPGRHGARARRLGGHT